MFDPLPQFISMNFSKNFLSLAGLILGSVAQGQIAFNSVSQTYSQDFNTLGGPGSAADIAWADNSTLPGWYAGTRASGNTYVTPATYKFTAIAVDQLLGSQSGIRDVGLADSIKGLDRAFGFQPSGTTSDPAGGKPAAVGVRLTNNTGLTVISLVLTFTGEQWSQGYWTTPSAVAEGIQVSYSTDATAINAGTYNNVPALQFNAPVVVQSTNSTRSIGLDGNAAANRHPFTGVTFTIVGGWAPGTDLWIRWTDLGAMIPAGIAGGQLASVVTIDDVTIGISATISNPVAPGFTTQPASQTVNTGANVTFTVEASGTPTPAYQWQKDGVNITGATNASLILSSVTAADAGSYTVVVTNSAGSVTSDAAVLTVGGGVTKPGQLVNLSIRTGAGAGAQTLIAGFVADGGTGNTSLLVRGIGPALTGFGVPGALADPQLAIFDSATPPNQIQINDDWDSALASTFAQVGAFALTTGSKDSALLAALAPAPYTAQISGVGGTTGVALAEIYNTNTTLDATKPVLVNVSARAQVDTGAGIMIAGFVIGGDTPVTVLIRAIGLRLSDFGVTGVLADSQLAVFDSATPANQIAYNDDWDSALAATFMQVGAFELLTDTKSAALKLTLAPGAYTAQVSGVGGTTGVALVEVYAVP